MTKKMQPFWWFLSPLVPCPEGEQIVNGGFETGDFTGWTNTGWTINERYAGCNDPAANIGCPHTGQYSAYSYSMAGLLRQDFATLIPVRCITSFGLWVETRHETTLIIVTIGYTEGDPTIVYLDTAPNWTYLDLLGYCEAGKTISYIEIWYQNSYYMGNIDDVSLIC
jgi:hypothetical protein